MQKKFISVLLTLLMMAGVIAVAPIMAHAANWDVGTATQLEDAIDQAANGDTIKLLADIDYTDLLEIRISGYTLTFDLNGKTLNATGGLWVEGTTLLLADPTNGALNVSLDDNDSTALVVVNGKAEVTNVTATGADMNGVAAYENSEVIVYGTITAATTYIHIEGVDKTKAQNEATSSKVGYLEYKGTDGTDTSYVWVKCQAHTFGTAWLSDATNHWHAACSKCGAADTPAAHTPGNWATVLEPTTTAQGSRQKRCTVCQAITATEAIAVLKAVGLFGMNTTYPSNFLNWFLFIVCFGFIWMWF